MPVPFPVLLQHPVSSHLLLTRVTQKIVHLSHVAQAAQTQYVTKDDPGALESCTPVFCAVITGVHHI